MSYDSRLLFEMVSAYLNESPCHTLRVVSNELRVSERTIEKAVRSSTGQSFKVLRRQAFLAHITMLFATQPNVPIKEVSFALGFKSCSSFSRAVRRASGLSPQQLRSFPSYCQSAPHPRTAAAGNLVTFRRPKAGTGDGGKY